MLATLYVACNLGFNIAVLNLLRAAGVHPCSLSLCPNTMRSVLERLKAAALLFKQACGTCSIVASAFQPM